MNRSLNPRSGRRPLAWSVALACSALLSACASAPPVQAPQPAGLPGQWSPQPAEAALPHEGRLGQLGDWWRQQADPVLADFIEAAQAASPGISAATARRAQARAEAAAQTAALGPQVDAFTSLTRRSATPTLPAGDEWSRGLQLSWELDVLGGQRSARQAALWRWQGADAAWHDARVTLAADVAQQVFGWRACSAVAQLLASESRSWDRSAELSRQLSGVGLQAPELALGQEAAAATARNRSRQQQARCDIQLKTLVMLTALPEATVRQRLVGSGTPLTLRRPVWQPAVPAAALAQRPDVAQAAAAVAAAAGDLGAQQAQRYPRVGLTGFVARTRLNSSTLNGEASSWSIGPLTVSLPLWDGGRRAAAVEAAEARYRDARRQHEAVVRRAVKEVEEALLLLDSSHAQAQDAQTARDAAQQALQAAEQRARQGLASGLEVEEARRRQLSAHQGWVQWQVDRLSAWITLYRAAGGGWNPAQEPTITK